MVSAGTNYAINPSWEGTNTFTNTSNCTVSLSTDHPYVGTKTLLVTSTVEDDICSVWNTAASRIPIAEGEDINTAVRAFGMQPDGYVRVTMEFYDDAVNNNVVGFSLDSGWIALDADDYTQIAVIGHVVPPLATHLQILLETKTGDTPATAIGDEWHFDALVVRRSEAHDSYFDGDQGEGFSWLGTAHASASTRAAGAGEITRAEYESNQLVVSWEVWRADEDGNLVEDLTAHLSSGFIEGKADRDVPVQGEIALVDANLLDPFSDFVALFLTVAVPPTMESETYRMGLYEVMLPTITAHWNQPDGTFALRDLTIRLAESALSDSITIAAGTNAFTAAKDIAEDFGASVQFPANSITLPVAQSYAVGENGIEAINKVLETGNGYPVWMDFDSYKIVTEKIRDLNAVTPWMTYTPDMLLETPTVRPVRPSIPNVVLVIKSSSDETPIVGEARNDDIGSPTSTVARGREIIHVIKDSTVATASEADVLAAEVLQELNSFETAIDVLVPPTRPPGLHDVVSLSYHNNDFCLCGKYWIQSFRYEILGTSALSLSLGRTKEIVHT